MISLPKSVIIYLFNKVHFLSRLTLIKRCGEVQDCEQVSGSFPLVPSPARLCWKPVLNNEFDSSEEAARNARAHALEAAQAAVQSQAQLAGAKARAAAAQKIAAAREAAAAKAIQRAASNQAARLQSAGKANNLHTTKFAFWIQCPQPITYANLHQNCLRQDSICHNTNLCYSFSTSVGGSSNRFYLNATNDTVTHFLRVSI